MGYLSDDWRARVEHTKTMIEVAQAIDVPVVHTVSGKLPEDLTIPAGFGRLKTVYSELLEFADKTSCLSSRTKKASKSELNLCSSIWQATIQL